MQTYDPKKVKLIIGGVPISGFSDGTKIALSRSTETFSKKVGTDGDVTRVKSNDKSGEGTFTLHQSSLSNDYLSGLAKVDEELGTGIVPVVVKDVSGTSKYASAFAWIRKPADAEFGKDLTDREWVMDFAKLEMFNGGNLIIA